MMRAEEVCHERWLLLTISYQKPPKALFCVEQQLFWTTTCPPSVGFGDWMEVDVRRVCALCGAVRPSARHHGTIAGSDHHHQLPS